GERQVSAARPRPAHAPAEPLAHGGRRRPVHLRQQQLLPLRGAPGAPDPAGEPASGVVHGGYTLLPDPGDRPQRGAAQAPLQGEGAAGTGPGRLRGAQDDRHIREKGGRRTVTKDGYNLDPADLPSLARRGNVIPLCRDIAADLLTPVAAFLRIARGARHPFLLESVEGGETVARYSFLGRDPTTVLRGGPGSSEGPLEALRRAVSPFRAVRFPDLPRFAGGAVGYLSYDIVRLLERLPEGVRDDLRVPDLLFGIYDTVLAFDHLRQRIQIVSNIKTEEGGEPVAARALLERYRRARRLIEATERLLARPAVSRTLRRPGRSRWTASVSEARYKAGVRRAKEYIRAGDIFQVVLSQRFDRRSSAAPFGIYRALRRINPSPYMYYLDFGELSL